MPRRMYTNENFPFRVVQQLRQLGHDVVTSFDAGQANRRIPDEAVLAFAASERRILITQNQRDFLRLHNSGTVRHSGIIVCTADLDFVGQAERIDQALASCAEDLSNELIRVNRPPIVERSN